MRISIYPFKRIFECKARYCLYINSCILLQPST